MVADILQMLQEIPLIDFIEPVSPILGKTFLDVEDMGSSLAWTEVDSDIAIGLVSTSQITDQCVSITLFFR